MIAAYLLEVHDSDLEWDVDRFQVKGAPDRFKTMKEIAFAAYNKAIPGIEPGLEAVSYYDPPNMTYPFGAYICVADIDVDTGVTAIRRFYALDDCGTRINPMIIEGQVHGGLTEALAIAMGQEIAYDETGNVSGGSFLDYYLPTAVETPVWETDFTVTPSPHHPIGAKGVGESPNVGGVSAFLQCSLRRLRPSGPHPYPDAARPLAGLENGAEARAGEIAVDGLRSPRIAAAARRGGLYRRGQPGDGPDACHRSPAPAAAGGRSGGGQDRGGQGPGARARCAPDSPAML